MALYKVSAAGATIIATGNLTVKSVRWVGATTAAHGLVIQDSASNELFKSTASGANYVEESILDRRWWNGFKVTTLGSGDVYVEAE